MERLHFFNNQKKWQQLENLNIKEYYLTSMFHLV